MHVHTHAHMQQKMGWGLAEEEVRAKNESSPAEQESTHDSLSHNTPHHVNLTSARTGVLEMLREGWGREKSGIDVDGDSASQNMDGYGQQEALMRTVGGERMERAEKEDERRQEDTDGCMQDATNDMAAVQGEYSSLAMGGRRRAASTASRASQPSPASQPSQPIPCDRVLERQVVNEQESVGGRKGDIRNSESRKRKVSNTSVKWTDSSVECSHDASLSQRDASLSQRDVSHGSQNEEESYGSQREVSGWIQMAQLTQSAQKSAQESPAASGSVGSQRMRQFQSGSSSDSVSVPASLFTNVSHVSQEVVSAAHHPNKHTQAPAAQVAVQHGDLVSTSSIGFAEVGGVDAAGTHVQKVQALDVIMEGGGGGETSLQVLGTSVVRTSIKLAHVESRDKRLSRCKIWRFAPVAPTLRHLLAQAEVLNSEYLGQVRDSEQDLVPEEIVLPLPEMVYTGAVYSKPEDVPREDVKFAGRIFRVACTHKSFLPEFTSALANVSSMGFGSTDWAEPHAGIGKRGARHLLPHVERSGYHNVPNDGMQTDAAECRNFIYRPVRGPPTRKAVRRWLRAQERKKVGGAAKSFETADMQIDSAGRLCFHPAADVDGDSDFDANTPLGHSLDTCDTPAVSRRRSARKGSQSCATQHSSINQHSSIKSREHSGAGAGSRNNKAESGAVGGAKASSAMIRELLDQRPPSPRYDESFLVAASYAPMSQGAATSRDSWSQDSEVSHLLESPIKTLSLRPSKARMQPRAMPHPTSGTNPLALSTSRCNPPAASASAYITSTPHGKDACGVTRVSGAIPTPAAGTPRAQDTGAAARAGPAAAVGGSGAQVQGGTDVVEGCGYELTMLSLEVQCQSRRPNKGLPALHPDPRFDEIRAICYVIQVRSRFSRALSFARMQWQHVQCLYLKRHESPLHSALLCTQPLPSTQPLLCESRMRVTHTHFG